MDASKLLDALIKRQNLKNDAALCRALKIAPPTISKARARNSISAEMLVNMHETFDMPTKEIRRLGE